MNKITQKDLVLDAYVGKEEVQRFSKNTKTLIRRVAFIPGLLFTYLKLRGVSLIPFSDDVGAAFIIKIFLVIYYTSWVQGLISDVSDQEIAYLRAPSKGRLPLLFITIGITIGVFFLYLCWARTPKELLFVLSLFWIFDHLARLYLIRFIKRSAYLPSENNLIKTKSWYRLELLSIVFNYVDGKYVWYRFGVGIILLALLGSLIYAPLALEITKVLNFHSHKFTFSLGVLAYVMVIEIWIWWMRMRTKISGDLLKRLDSKYVFTSK